MFKNFLPYILTNYLTPAILLGRRPVGEMSKLRQNIIIKRLLPNLFLTNVIEGPQLSAEQRGAKRLRQSPERQLGLCRIEATQDDRVLLFQSAQG